MNLSWGSNMGDFHKGSKRTTFTDDAAKHSKGVPAPSFYFGKGHQTRGFGIPLGTMAKCKTDDFLTLAMKDAKKKPGPTSYDAKVSYIQINFLNLACRKKSSYISLILLFK